MLAADFILQPGISTTTFNERMRITQGGRVGIGRTATTNILEVEGNASKTPATAWLANSDRRIKKDIRPVSGAPVVLDAPIVITQCSNECW